MTIHELIQQAQAKFLQHKDIAGRPIKDFVLKNGEEIGEIKEIKDAIAYIIRSSVATAFKETDEKEVVFENLLMSICKKHGLGISVIDDLFNFTRTALAEKKRKQDEFIGELNQ